MITKDFTMSQTLINWLLGLLSAAMTGVTIWGLSIQTRVTTLETQYEDLKYFLEDKFKSLAERLDRIESAVRK